MSYKAKKQGLWGRMLAAFAKDEDTSPEDLAAAAKLNPEAQDDGEERPPLPPQKEEAPQEEKPAFDADEMNERLTRIEDALAALAKPKEEPPAKKEEPTALDDLEQKLKGDEPEAASCEEDDVEVPPEEINKAHGEAEDDEEVIEPQEDEGGDQQAVRDAALSIIDGLKPIIASLPPAQRKKAADSMAALLRGHIDDSQYGVLARAMKNGHAAKDANPIMDDAAYGRMIRDQYNPHYKKN